MTTQRTELDNSILMCVSECSLKTALLYVLHMRSTVENLYFKSGNAIHAFLESFFQDKHIDDCLRDYHDFYFEWAESKPDLPEAYTYRNIEKILKYWAFLNKDRVFPFDVVHTEKGFRVPLVDDIDFVGRIDLVVREKLSKMYAPLDHKSTGRMDAPWKAKWGYSSQLTGYMWALEKVYGEQCWGAYVNGVNVKNVPGSPRKCPTHGVAYSQCGVEHTEQIMIATQRTREHLQTWWKTAIKLAWKFMKIKEAVKTIEDIKNIPDEGTFNDSCRFCEFKEFCHYGRRMDTVDTLMRVEKWEPIGGREILEPK